MQERDEILQELEPAGGGSSFEREICSYSRRCVHGHEAIERIGDIHPSLAGHVAVHDDELLNAAQAVP